MDSENDIVARIANRIRQKHLDNADETYNMKTNAIIRRLIDIFEEDSKEWTDLMDEFGLISSTHLASTIRLTRELDINLFEQALEVGDEEAVAYENSLE